MGLPYYKRFPRDFLEGTAGLSFETKGAYGIVLDLIYMHDGRLPDNARYIAGQLGCSVRRWSAIRGELISAGKLEAGLGIISNFRADQLTEETRSFQNKQAENAGRPRKFRDLQQPLGIPKETQPEPEPEPESKKEGAIAPSKETERPDLGDDLFADEASPLGESLGTTSSSEELRARANSTAAAGAGRSLVPAVAGRGAVVADDGFEVFWRAYPRKVDKSAARKAFDRAVKAKKATPAELLAGAERYAAERRGEDQKFTKHAATWLNGECWKNDPRDGGGIGAVGPFGGPNTPSGAAAGILSYFDGRETI